LCGCIERCEKQRRGEKRRARGRNRIGGLLKYERRRERGRRTGTLPDIATEWL